MKSADGENEESASEEVSEKVRHWRSQISAGKEATKDTNDYTEEAWNEYLNHGYAKSANKQILKRTKSKNSRFPIYWASISSIKPALYSRIPIPQAQKVFDALDDNIAKVACLCYERLAKYLISKPGFDIAMSKAVDNFIHGAKATARIFCDPKISQTPQKKYITQIQVPAPQQQQPQVDQNGQPMQPQQPPQMQMVWIDSEGEPVQDTSAIQQDEQGYYIENVEEMLESVEICVEPVHYKDILHTPNARHEGEITWKAFRTSLTKSEVTEKFGEEVAAEIPYTDYKESDQEKTKKSSKEAGIAKYAGIWEIWDKSGREVIWIADNYDKELQPLDYEGGDIYELNGFFPCAPFLLGTVGPDNMYPTPDFVQLQPFIMQLHALAERFKTQVRATRRKGLFDSTVPELKKLADDNDEGEFLGVKNLQQLSNKAGGMDNLVWYFPVDKMATAVDQMSQVIQLYQQQFNELWGISDIIRGVSDPHETAAAQQMKGKFYSLRFSTVQRQFQNFARDVIELMCDLALKKFPESKLIEVMGINFAPPEEQQLWPRVKLLLQDDQERKVRIDVQTDSTITMNQEAELEHRNNLSRTIFEGLSGMGNLMQISPNAGALLGKLVLFAVRGMKDGKQIEEELAQTVEALAQPQPQAQEEANQPDPAKMAMVEVQDRKNQMDAQIAQAKLAIAQQDLQLKAQQLQVELQKIATAAESETTKRALETQIAALDHYIQSERLKLDEQYIALDMRERIATEQRLQREEGAKEQPKQEGKKEQSNLTVHLHG